MITGSLVGTRTTGALALPSAPSAGDKGGDIVRRMFAVQHQPVETGGA